MIFVEIYVAIMVMFFLIGLFVVIGEKLESLLDSWHTQTHLHWWSK